MDGAMIGSRWRCRAGVAVLFVVLAAACAGDGNGGSGGDLTEAEAAEELASLLEEIDVTDDPVDRRAEVELGAEADLAASLPDIEEFSLVVDPSSAGTVVEIFTSSEKAGEDTDGWLVEVADAFNDADVTLAGGQEAKVAIRQIPSGIGYQFIASGTYMPDAFTPSNHLWIEMARASGAEMTPVRESLVGNVAGIVMKTDVAEALGGAGSLDAASVIDNVASGDLVMGYTNPYASSTGLNFLVTVLDSFAGGDEARMLAPDVVSTFERFQDGVPFVALTTLQLRDSVEQDQSLDAFVMESQTFENTEALQSGFEFTPFGITHDNPLYAVGADSEATEALELFASFAEDDQYADLAADFGFNPAIDYESGYEVPSGETLIAAQRVWKENKDAGRRVVAVFVTDTSGSMNGTRINALQAALLADIDFITPENSIGLVEFNHQVTRRLPIAEFDLNQKAAFAAAVEDLPAEGDTAMYDGVLVGLDMLLEAQATDPEIKPLLFVLTDGETEDGHSFDDVRAVIDGIGIPVYTVGFEADLDELDRLASLVEAASLDASQQDVEYEIGSLFNAEL
jgi:Ca-activated chloride channel family protein